MIHFIMSTDLIYIYIRIKTEKHFIYRHFNIASLILLNWTQERWIHRCNFCCANRKGLKINWIYYLIQWIITSMGINWCIVPVKKACMQNNRLWSTWHSNSCKMNDMKIDFDWFDEIKFHDLWNANLMLTFVSIERVSVTWKCNFNFDFPSSLEPRNCENLYCHTTFASAPSVNVNPDCQSNVRPPLRPWWETANVFR